MHSKITLGRAVKRAVLGAALFAATAAPSAIAQGPAPDPERASTQPTGWNWRAEASVDQINELLNAGNRIIDLEVAQSKPLRFTVTTVKNQGTYARNGGWYPGKSANDLHAKVVAAKGRLIDVEAYTSKGKTRFAGVYVRNEGPAAKDWQWHPSLSSGQVAAKVKEHKSRLIDIESFVAGGKRRYAVVMIANGGVDAAGWGWFPGNSMSEILSWTAKNQQRLLDVEPIGGGKYAAVTVQGTPFNLLASDRTAEQVNDLLSRGAIRITDIETYLVGGQRRFFVHGIDNADANNAAVRHKAFSWDRLAASKWGMWLKPVGGAPIVSLGADREFEPASALKILHHTYVHRLLALGQAKLTDTFAYPDCPPMGQRGPNCRRWMEQEKGAPIPGNICPAADELHVQTQGTLDWQDRVMMSNSDNRTTMGIENRYGRATLNAFARNVVGTTNTEINHNIGCGSPANRTTLVDLARMVEGVADGRLVTAQSVRDRYFQTMNQANGVSPALAGLIAEEANRVGKGAIVDKFIALVDYKGKGGSYGVGSLSVSAGFGRVVFPFRADGSQPVQFSYGHYLNCTNDCMNDAYAGARDKSYGAASMERFRPAVRAALAGW
jgi:hypothetical protein